MTERVVVNAERIDELAVELRCITEEVVAALRVFDEKCSALRADWTGAASDAYERARVDWRGRADRATAVLDTAARNIAGASTAFAEAETANIARW